MDIKSRKICLAEVACLVLSEKMITGQVFSYAKNISGCLFDWDIDRDIEKSIEKAPETKKVRGNPYDRWY